MDDNEKEANSISLIKEMVISRVGDVKLVIIDGLSDKEAISNIMLCSLDKMFKIYDTVNFRTTNNREFQTLAGMFGGQHFFYKDEEYLRLCSEESELAVKLSDGTFLFTREDPMTSLECEVVSEDYDINIVVEKTVVEKIKEETQE